MGLGARIFVHDHKSVVKVESRLYTKNTTNVVFYDFRPEIVEY